MRAKWRKIIWAILAVQLLIFHMWCLGRIHRLDYFVSRALSYFKIPVAIGMYWKILMIFVWLLVAGGIMIWHGIHYSYFRRGCIQNLMMVTEEWIKKIYLDALEESGLSNRVGKRRSYENFVYCSNHTSSPFVIGFLQPILLIPQREYGHSEWKLIFLHECRHMKKYDTWYKLFMLFMQSILWFQPLIYLLKEISFRDIEVACDEAVVEGKNIEERTAYAQVLIESMKIGRQPKQVYSNYFYNGKKIIKARIAAVMDTEKKWDKLAFVAIVILIFETVAMLIQMGCTIQQNYKKEAESVNIYDGYEVPESFTVSAMERMLEQAPVGEDDYYNEYCAQDIYEQKEYADLPYDAQGPWQIRIKDADQYAESIGLLLDRYLYYYEDQELGSIWNPEDNPYIKIEVDHLRLLAGNKEEAVFVVLFKEYVGEEYQNLTAYQEGWTKVARWNGSIYAYYNLAVHIRMAEDYVFELVGVADAKKTIDAFKNKYPTADFSDIPELVLRADIQNMNVSNYDTYSFRTSEGILEMAKDSDSWEEVPVELSDVFTRGDEMDGTLTALQQHSYQLNQTKTIFAYGGGEDLPVTVTYYDEQENNWKNSVVTTKSSGVRRLFLSFPESSEVGYLVLTMNRVVWQEETILFKTEDGGSTWHEIGPAGPDFYTQGHSLTTGMVFITDSIGFLTIRDSETPNIWRTEDGGNTWEKQTLTYVPEYYSMAYAPDFDGTHVNLYLSMEGYSEYGGTKAHFISDDYGATWEYAGLVIRQ